MADEKKPKYRDIPPHPGEVLAHTAIDTIGMSRNNVAVPASLGDIRTNYVGWEPTHRRELIEEPKESPKALEAGRPASAGLGPSSEVYSRYTPPQGLPAGPRGLPAGPRGLPPGRQPKALPDAGAWWVPKGPYPPNTMADSFKQKRIAEAEEKRLRRNEQARKRRAAKKESPDGSI